MRRRSSVSMLVVGAIAVACIAGGLLAWQLLGDGKAPAGSHEHGGGPRVAHADTTASKQLYTCGMHPNVIQEGPGTCPICGMDLTPLKAGAQAGSATKQPGERKIKYWVAPMDPTYIRDKPGKSPMGMDLVPVYEGAAPDGKGTVTVDPVMVQNMGVRVAHAKRGELSRRVRTIGEVVVAEDLVSVVNLKYSGWIEKLHVDQTGVRVRRGQALFSVYSPELVSAQEEYLLALRSAGKDSPLARSARARLAFWDLGDSVAAKIAQRGKALRTLTITAPRTGYVLHKNVVQGAKVNAGQDLFRIGQLDAIWVHAQVYEFDAPWIRVGQKATMELAFEKGRQYAGKVSYIYPTLERKTRTLTVRLEFVNPSLQLKPGMFTTVWLETRQRSGVLTIPTEAIIHSGERNIVFVADGVGKYAPRQVVTGLAGDGHVTEILSGINDGEVVVVSGQFLLDSESQLQEAMQKLLAARLQTKQRKPGASAAPKPAAQEQKKHAQQELWTCPMHPQIAEPKAGSCPICGMDLVPKSAAPRCQP